MKFTIACWRSMLAALPPNLRRCHEAILCHRSIFICRCAGCAAADRTGAGHAASALKRPNIPDHFTNLTVLPATISKTELLGVMKQFAATMKARCSYCHAVSDDLSEGSFASDEKPTKEEARKLIRLIHEAMMTPAKP